jgi:hypothetical protein
MIGKFCDQRGEIRRVETRQIAIPVSDQFEFEPVRQAARGLALRADTRPSPAADLRSFRSPEIATEPRLRIKPRFDPAQNPVSSASAVSARRSYL